jgi:hypothetical protein
MQIFANDSVLLPPASLDQSETLLNSQVASPFFLRFAKFPLQTPVLSLASKIF